MNLFDVYPLTNVEPERAKGSFIWDKYGKKYLDLYGGHAVISIGHSHPHYIERIEQQLRKIGFYSNSVQIPLQKELAQKLSLLSGYPDHSLFLCNSGAEANENALKLASFHNGRKKVIAFRNSFHGRTSLALEVTDDPGLSAAINRNGNVIFLSMKDANLLEKHIDHETTAVIIEGIQGVGGVHEPGIDFLKTIRKICTEKGALLILDEIQSGCGRTGKFFAHQYAGIEADLITMAKGLGNGFPIGGVLIHSDIKSKHGLLGTTFGGNHLACAAALAVLEVMEEENLMANADTLGKSLFHLLEGHSAIKEIRGRGLMIGLEISGDSKSLRNLLLEQHFIFTGISAAHNTIRLLPALNISESELKLFMNAFESLTQIKTVSL